MAVPIKIPDVGAAVDEVTFVRWLIDEGAQVARGQKIAEIETDKAVVALESVAAGVLLKKTVAEGEDRTVGDVIAYVGDPSDTVPESESAGPVAAPLDYRPQLARAREVAKPRVSPMLRNFAKQKGVDVDSIVGTGKDGMVTRQDIIEVAQRRAER